MENLLTKEDCKFILESLKYTVLAFENYKTYPSYEYKLKRINDAREVAEKVAALKKSL
jgi:hypothetical protein